MEAWFDCGDCATTFRHLEAETVCDRKFLQSNRARGTDQMEFAGNGGVCRCFLAVRFRVVVVIAHVLDDQCS